MPQGRTPITMPRDTPAQQRGARALPVPDLGGWRVVKSEPLPEDAPPTTSPRPDAPDLPPHARTILDSALDFGGGLWSTINPIPAVKAIATHPLDTARGLVEAQADQFRKAGEDLTAGRYSDMVGHGIAGVLPFVGPAAAEAGETIGRGDIARGLGETVGLIAPFGARAAAGRAIPAVAQGTAGIATKMAHALDRTATTRMTDAMAPALGRNRYRFGNMAREVAPDVARDPQLAAVTRSGLLDKLTDAHDGAMVDLEAAYDAIPKNKAYRVGGIVQGLEAKLHDLQVQGMSQHPRAGAPAAFSPATRAAEIAALQRAIEEAKSLGPVANIDNLRSLRQAWDAGGQTRYTPSIVQDYLAARGAGSGWASAADVVRDVLRQSEPQLAAPNAAYSLYRTALDVMKAAEEIEQSRARVGRNITTGAGGAVMGHAIGGTPGAAVGAVVGPLLDATLRKGRIPSIVTARVFAKAADALRHGQTPAAQAALTELVQRAGLAGEVGDSLNLLFAPTPMVAGSDDARPRPAETVSGPGRRGGPGQTPITGALRSGRTPVTPMRGTEQTIDGQLMRWDGQHWQPVRR